MVDVWKCSPCQKWMSSADRCSTCNITWYNEIAFTNKKQSELITKMTRQDLLQLQNGQAQKPKVESKLVEESKDEDVVMWKCLLCKVYMDLNTEKCTKCDQRNKDDLVVDVKKEELYEDLNGQKVSMQEASDKKQQLPQYW